MRRSTIGRALIAVAAAAMSACAAKLMKLPAGTGTAVSDGREALAQATAACDRVATLTAEIGVSGSAAGHRVRARLLAGVAAPDSVRLEAAAPFGQPLFIFVTRRGDATLLLPRDNRVLEHGSPADVLAAIAGVPLPPAELRTTLTGCASAPQPDRARAIGVDWRIIPDGTGELYLHKSAAWQIVAAVRHDPEAAWRAEYRDFASGLPTTIRIAGSSRPPFDLTLRLSQVDTNQALGADAFRVQVPPTAQPITIDELRRGGPLGRTSAAGRDDAPREADAR